jgi:hypothetical protein
MNPELFSLSSMRFWHNSYCCIKLKTESPGHTKVLKYKFNPSDLHVVLVNGKKLCLKYTSAHVFLLAHMFWRCVFSAKLKFPNHVCATNACVEGVCKRMTIYQVRPKLLSCEVQHMVKSTYVECVRKHLFYEFCHCLLLVCHNVVKGQVVHALSSSTSREPIWMFPIFIR